MTTLLLVEDACDLAQVIVRDLEAAGYRVLHAADGLTGVQLFTDYQPDLVILDWMLPRLDGLEVLRRIRQHSAVPVLMLTARAEEADRVIGLEVGADDYLIKPFGMRELIARVRVLLRRIEHVQQLLTADREPTATPVTYGPLRLDPSGFQATLDGGPLELTRTEHEPPKVPLKGGAAAADPFVLLQHEDLAPLVGEQGPGREAAAPGADHNCIVVCHLLTSLSVKRKA